MAEHTTTTTTTANTQKTLYFAYGSNLSLAQMRSRCPTSTYHALSVLKGWKWIIGERGYANVIAVDKNGVGGDRGLDRVSESQSKEKKKTQREEEKKEKEQDVVYGMLYWLEAEDEAELDLAEGVPYAYVKRWLDVEIVVPSTSASDAAASVADGGAGAEVTKVKALVYVDEKRKGEGKIREEYVRRMNRGIRDALKVGTPESYVRRVLRRWVRDEDGGEVEDPFHPSKMR